MSGKDIQITLTGEPAPIMTMLQYLGRQPDFAESKVYDSVDEYLARMPQEPAKRPGLKDRDVLTTIIPKPTKLPTLPLEIDGMTIVPNDRPSSSLELPVKPQKKSKHWQTPVLPSTDAEIDRLNKAGKKTTEISSILSGQGINLTWQQVRGRIAYMARKGHNSPKAEGKPQEVQLPVEVPDLPARAEPSPLTKRIIELDHQKMTPHTISNILEEENGAIVSEAEIMDIIIRNAKGML